MLTFLFCRISIFLSGWARSKIYLQPFPIIKESVVWLKTSFCLMSMTLTTFFWFTHMHHRKETKEPGKEIHSITETNFRCINTWLKQLMKCTVCLSVFRLSFQDNRYNKKKEKQLLRPNKWTQKICLKQNKRIARHSPSTWKKKTVSPDWRFILKICSGTYGFSISSRVSY